MTKDSVVSQPPASASTIFPASLIRDIREQYRLPWDGIHGVSHWARVLENGLRLAPLTGAKPEVVRLFAIFHDARRVNESWDPNHGRRGADLAESLRGQEFDLTDEDFELLRTACVYHTDGLTEGDVTVQTCWDSDRLDLGRVGIWPEPRYLCTDAAKDRTIIEWSRERSMRRHVPEFAAEWDDTPGKRRPPLHPG